MNKLDYNPDILSCLASLSSDEVFTSPKIVNEMLDLLPPELWSDKNAKFLDPVSKTGIFLREISKRLSKGLEAQIPDKQKRVNHILSNQLYGIAITELTSLVSRRSLYCSKSANGKYSVCTEFKNSDGNIKFDKFQHTWKDGRCIHCGASQEVYDREDELESHAYEFIHTEKPEAIFDMRFDVIIGNPPYQLSDGTGGLGSSAVPIYQLFVQQAKKLNPRFLTMIIPARWYAGGRGLDEFRTEMLNDKRISKLVDYFDSTECFPGVDISGGVCYFLWEKDKKDDCEVVSRRGGQESKMTRPLLEKGADSFIRFNEAIHIVRKISGTSFESAISSSRPFGPRSNVPIKEKPFESSIKCYTFPKTGYIDSKLVTRNQTWIKKYKVYIAKAYGERGSLPYLVIAKPFIGEKGSICSETYLVAGVFDTESEAKNLISYLYTRFVRFLILLKKNTQNSTKGVYSLVPIQDFSKPWTDEELNKKYKLTKEEINIIEGMIRLMTSETQEEVIPDESED